MHVPGAQGLFLLAAITAPASLPQPHPDNWCQVGQMVMIPDGREGPVTSVDGDICRVLAYGEKYVGLWTYDMIEPVGPPPERRRWHHGP